MATEEGEVDARTCVKIVWNLCQRVVGAAEVGEIGAISCVKTVWKFCQGIAVLAEVGEVCRCVSVASVIVNEVEALQYVIESTQTI